MMAEDLLLRSWKLSENSVASAKWISELHFCFCYVCMLVSHLGNHLPERGGYERARFRAKPYPRTILRKCVPSLLGGGSKGKITKKPETSNVFYALAL